MRPLSAAVVFSHVARLIGTPTMRRVTFREHYTGARPEDVVPIDVTISVVRHDDGKPRHLTCVLVFPQELQPVAQAATDDDDYILESPWVPCGTALPPSGGGSGCGGAAVASPSAQGVCVGSGGAQSSAPAKVQQRHDVPRMVELVGDDADDHGFLLQ